MASKKTAKRPRKPDKPHVWLSDELGTSLVAEATYSTDITGLCARFNVSSITLERWRKRVASDAGLSELVAEKRKLQAEVWDVGLRNAARELISALMHQAKLAQACQTFDPAMVHKLAGALKIVNDAATTRGMLLVQPAPVASKDSQPAKTAGMGDRPAGGAVSGGRDGGGIVPAVATTTATGAPFPHH